MKKQKFRNLKLSKTKIADLSIAVRISGGSAAACETAESVIICEVGDTGGGGATGGGGDQTILVCGTHTQQLCGPTQNTCGGTGTLTCGL